MAEDITEREFAEVNNNNSDDSIDHRDLLEKFRVDFVQTLDVERQFIFSYLRSKSVIDEEDCERIVNAGAGRQQKVSKFLDVLACKGEEGCRHFVDSLEFEHSILYEKVTGKKASATRTSQMLTAGSGGWLASTGLFGKELIDYDRQYLANQLEKTTGDFQMLTYVHSKMVREKSNLEERLMEATGDLQNHQKHVEDLQEELTNITASAVVSQKFTVENMETINHNIQNLIQENMDKSNAIITLQHRLLLSTEERDQTKLLMEELRKKNEALMQQCRDLTINYDWERRQSKRLSERVQRQTDEIRKSEDVRREIYELKFKLSEVREERDDLNEQLQEFRRVTEALNNKFDLMVQEKAQVLEIHEGVSETIFDFQQQIYALEMKLKESNLELREARRKNSRMVDEINTYREQRRTLLQEREAKINERNAALKERDESLRMNVELQLTRDEAVTKHISVNKGLELKYKTMLNELDETRQELNRMESKLRSSELMMQRQPTGHSILCCSDSEVTKKKEKTDKIPDDIDSEEADDGTAEELSPNKFNWKQRSATEVLNSACNRVKESRSSTFLETRSVSVPSMFTIQHNTEGLGPIALTDLRNIASETTRCTSPNTIHLMPVSGSQPKRIILGGNCQFLEISKPSSSSFAIRSDDETETSPKGTKSKPELENNGSGKSAENGVNGIKKIRRKSLPACGVHRTIEPAAEGITRKVSSAWPNGSIFSSIIPSISDLSIGIAVNRDTLSSSEKRLRGSPHSKRKLAISVIQKPCQDTKGGNSPRIRSPVPASKQSPKSKSNNTDQANGLNKGNGTNISVKSAV